MEMLAQLLEDLSKDPGLDTLPQDLHGGSSVAPSSGLPASDFLARPRVE